MKENLHFLLMKCFYHNNRMIVQRIQGTGLLPGQPKILECLWEQDGVTPKEIGRSCGLDKSTITGLLNKMEQQELICKKAQPADRRSVKIHLTDQGRRKAAQIKEIFHRVDTFAARDLLAAEYDELIRLLKKILDTYENKEDET